MPVSQSCFPVKRGGRTTKLLSLFLVMLTLFLSACSGINTGNGNTKPLRIVAKIGSEYAENFSPFDPLNGGVNGTQGLLYETLYFFNRYNGQESPVLASGYTWNDDFSEVTFKLNEARWSDGQPFTAQDVVFTFNMLKEYPAADRNAVWSYIDSITSTDDRTVVIKLQSSNKPSLYYIGGTVPIVAEHLWEDAGDPTQYTNVNPIGTGPYKLQQFTPDLVTYVKNGDHRAAGDYDIERLEFVVYKDNKLVQQDMIDGNVDWGGFFAPDLDNTYTARDEVNNHYWMSPISFTMIFVNLTKAPFNDVNFRKSLSDALDRDRMSRNVISGYVAPAHPAGITPGHSSLLAPEYKNMAFTREIDRANRTLDEAGYITGPDGIRLNLDGQPMSYEILVPAGWTDWEQFCQLISENVKSIGIEIKPTPVSQDDYYAARNTGNFDIMMSSAPNWGPDPYYIFDALLNSALTADIGEPAPNNWIRYRNADTDKWLKQLATTNDTAKKQEAYTALEKVMVEQQPVILLLNHPNWFVYSTKNFSGFPSEENPYALGAPYNNNDNAQIIKNLSPT